MLLEVIICEIPCATNKHLLGQLRCAQVSLGHCCLGIQSPALQLMHASLLSAGQAGQHHKQQGQGVKLLQLLLDAYKHTHDLPDADGNCWGLACRPCTLGHSPLLIWVEPWEELLLVDVRLGCWLKEAIPLQPHTSRNFIASLGSAKVTNP